MADDGIQKSIRIGRRGSEYRKLSLRETDMLSLRNVVHAAANLAGMKYSPDVELYSMENHEVVKNLTEVSPGQEYMVCVPSTIKEEDAPEIPIEPALIPTVASSSYFGEVRKVLIINTGGTISMVPSAQGFAPGRNAQLLEYLRASATFHDKDAYLQQEHGPGLLMPATLGEPYRVYLDIKGLRKTVDSVNMDHHSWATIADIIYETYDNYNGFVILHGTDTMAYTSSALAFMLQNLGKTVVVTGSQVPIFQPLTDGRANLLGSIHFAAHYVIPEVCVYFDSKLYRGCRSSKTDASSFHAFHSPNFPELATVGVKTTIRPHALPVSMKKFSVDTRFEDNIAVLRLFPGISKTSVQHIVADPIKGVVLQTFGAGNFPNLRTDLLELLKEATERDVVIVNCTQCSKGTVTNSYEAGRILEDVGIIPMYDITPEAALTKLGHVLAQDISLPQKRQILMSNLRGELTVPLTAEMSSSVSESGMFAQILKALQVKSTDEEGHLRRALAPYMLCAAAKTGDMTQVQQLLAAGFQPIIADYDGRTPLHLACAEGQLEIVRSLLGAGATLHTRDRFGNVALIDALRNGSLEVIELLMDVGATLDVDDRGIAKELCELAAADRHMVLQKWLIAGANPNAADYLGNTALHVATTHKSLNSLKVLVACEDIDLQAVNLSNQTAMDIAKARNFVPALEILRKASRTAEL